MLCTDPPSSFIVFLSHLIERNYFYLTFQIFIKLMQKLYHFILNKFLLAIGKETFLNWSIAAIVFNI